MEVWRMAEVRTAISDEIDSYLDALVQKGVFANKAELVRSALVRYVNETGTFFRGFDSENIFAPNGRIYQLEYAREASKRGMTAAGGGGGGGAAPPAPQTPRRPPGTGSRSCGGRPGGRVGSSSRSSRPRRRRRRTRRCG